MTEFSWAGILSVISICVATIVGAVPLFKLIGERIDQRKKEKAEKQNQHLSLSAEIAKIEAERDENEKEGLKELLQIYRAKCEECEKRLEQAENLSLISRPKKREINALMLKISKNLYQMEKGFEGKYHVLELEAIFKSIKKQFEELENLMP